MKHHSRRLFVFGLGAIMGALVGGVHRLLGDRPGGRPALLPPGALPRDAFLAACTRCGQCVQACPFATLRLASPAVGPSSGTPYFVPRDVPCYLCQGHPDLLCIDACPSSALQPVADVTAVCVGIAEIDGDICLAYNGTICRTCWHVCPFPNDAIRFDSRLRPVVNPSRCVGCGICEYACPTHPRSITVLPLRAGNGRHHRPPETAK